MPLRLGARQGSLSTRDWVCLSDRVLVPGGRLSRVRGNCGSELPLTDHAAVVDRKLL